MRSPYRTCLQCQRSLLTHCFDLLCHTDPLNMEREKLCRQCLDLNRKEAFAAQRVTAHQEALERHGPALVACRERRRKAQADATPEWLCRAEVAAIYEQARALSRSTGEMHHVDHMVPLQHRLVCGLHVPWNLRILPARENCRKSNKFDPERFAA